MFPSHVDGGFHIVGQDDELRRAAVVMGAETHDVYLSHSGRENSEKTGGEQGGRRGVRARSLIILLEICCRFTSVLHAHCFLGLAPVGSDQIGKPFFS
jgi:hypothetical protein